MEWAAAQETLISLAAQAAGHYRQHIALEHTLPGPSSVLSCRRQLWYKTHDTEPDRGLPEFWTMRQVAGTMLEPFWYVVLPQADARLSCLPFTEPIEIIEGIKGTPDGRFTQIPALLELKSETGWAFHYVSQGGTRAEKEEHYAQAQLYMHAAQAPWTLYLATVADPSFYANMMSKRKPYKSNGANGAKPVPWFYIEWIPYSQGYSELLVNRLVSLQADLAGDQVPMRDFDPAKGKWPCTYCRWEAKCRAAG
jgi:hypothetical protein